MDKLSQRKDSLVNKFNANDRKFHGHGHGQGNKIRPDPTNKGNYNLPHLCRRVCKPNNPNCYVNTAGFQKCVMTGLTTQSKAVKDQYEKHGNSVRNYCRKKYCTTISNHMYY